MTGVHPGPRRALVTGGSRGIGRAVVDELVGLGYHVVATHRSTSPTPDAGELAGHAADRLQFVPFDATDRSQVKPLMADATELLGGPPDTVVANAGINADELVLKLSDDRWDEVLEVNVTSVFRLTREVVRPMVRNHFGRIVLIGSVAGLTGAPGQANYAASKAALIGVARSLTREVAHRGITCNVVCPGPVATDMVAALPDARRRDLTALVPARRLGTPAEVAFVVGSLCDDRASYVSGAVIPVDGGLGMGH